MKRIDTELRRKFIKDTNFPIQVLESPYFEYFLELYEPTLGSKTAWDKLRTEISENFSGNPGKYLEYSKEIQGKIIKDILENQEYQRFTKDEELSGTLSETSGEIKRGIYSGAMSGKRFLSVDLRTANFQAFKWYSPGIVSGEKYWEGFVKRYTSLGSIISSKNLRQILLGQTNPGRLQGVERYLTWKITEALSPILPPEFTLISRTTDEAIWEIPGDDWKMTRSLDVEIRDKVREVLGDIDIKIEVFTIKMIQRFTRSGESILGFIKDFAWPLGKISVLKGVPKTYYPQIWKAWKGLDLNPTFDLVLLHEGELARFDYPLSIVKPKENEEGEEA